MARGDFRAAKALIRAYHVHPAELPTGAALDRLIGPASSSDPAALEFRRFLMDYSTKFTSDLAASRYPSATQFIRKGNGVQGPQDTSVRQPEHLQQRSQGPVRPHAGIREQAGYSHAPKYDLSGRSALPQTFRMPTLPISWDGEKIRAEDQFNGRADRRDVRAVFEHLRHDQVDKAFSIWNRKDLPGELKYREVSLQNVLKTMNTASPAMAQWFHQCARKRAINDSVLRQQVARREMRDAQMQAPSPYLTRSKPPKPPKPPTTSAPTVPTVPAVTQTQSLPAVTRQKSEPAPDATRHTRHDAMRKAAASRNETWRLAPMPEPTRLHRLVTIGLAQAARVVQYTFVKSAPSPEDIEQRRRARLQAGGTASRL